MQNTANRKTVIQELLDTKVASLLDVGCGPITPEYPYSQCADEVTCLDWRLKKIDPIPKNIKTLEADFINSEITPNSFDAVIAADVFEHVSLEQEQSFVQKCFQVLRPGGHLILSVPHLGTYSWLDPYQVKPRIHRLLWKFGLYKKTHNGFCDIRKGHKHYTIDELGKTFAPFEVATVRFWGYFFDPALSWVNSIFKSVPGILGWFEESCRKEFEKDYENRSFNVAVKLVKPMTSNT